MVMSKSAKVDAGTSVSDNDTWVEKECSACSFKDARLKRRFLSFSKSIAGTTGGSIPFVCQDWANTKAAYRFLSNEWVTETNILAGHFHSTRDRFAETDELVLVLHDTTEFTYKRENVAAIGITKKRLLDELSGWVWCFWVVGLLLNPVGRAFPVDVTGGGQGRAL